ncbi:hypothetical protein MUCCIDRAFT_157460 [Mucor lusitanicus CBS 277.49]|uniref:Uncharacterized protein n=1 Tax=Mucor lusitanicus CBS 277.49 TaxID=747725 RepID=A0A162YBA4_MUCCL|nr:hypothetical protein MUCCIDRAFT_157460 [Mucor lusitanicus CBS 277.49]
MERGNGKAWFLRYSWKLINSVPHLPATYKDQLPDFISSMWKLKVTRYTVFSFFFNDG